jgi:hypothetical protein
VVSILARILTGICGGVIVAVINRQTATLEGPALWLTLVVVFVIAFAAAGLLEKRLAAKPAPAPALAPDQGVGSDNMSRGKQEIDISPEAAAGRNGAVGSRNTAESDQKITIR